MLRARRLLEEDVLQCLNLDPGYKTDWVWQLERHDRGDETTFAIRPAPLPRPRAVDGFPIEPPLDERLLTSELALLLEDSEIAGYVLASSYGSTVILDMLVVDPARRRCGIGGRLLGEAKAWGQRRGCRLIEATVEARNFPAVRFLRRQGFSIRGVRDVAGHDDEVELILVGPIG
jgi:GNAT superfamily N-acetyltransferase